MKMSDPTDHPISSTNTEEKTVAANGIGDLWIVLERRRRLIFTSAAVVVALVVTATAAKLLLLPTYQGTFQLLIDDPVSPTSANRSIGPGATDTGSSLIESLARNRTTIDLATLVKVLSSPMVLNPIGRFTNQDPKDIAANLKLESPTDAVLDVTLTGHSPDTIRKTLNALAAAYLEFSLTQRQARLKEGLSFLNSQRPILSLKVRSAQDKLATFRERYSLIAPETEGASLKLQISNLEIQQRQLATEYDRLLKLRAGVDQGRLTADNFSTAGSANRMDAPPSSSSTITVTQASSDRLNQLRNVETQLSSLRATYRSDTPRVNQLSSLRNQLMQQLRQEQLSAVDNAISLNKTNKEAIESQTALLERQFLRQPQLIREYEDLQQTLKISQDNLSNLQLTGENFRLELSQNISPWKVIGDTVVGDRPIAPSIPKNLALGLVLGLATGVSAGLLRDRFDHVFNTAAEVRDQLNLPMLGHVPHVSLFQGVREGGIFPIVELERPSEGRSPESSSETSTYQRFYYQEAIRSLYSSLRFLNSERPLTSIALTSSVPKEGKSLLTILLAKTLVDLGLRVLLVDADLRKPQLHKRLGIDNILGLSNLLSSDLDSVETAVQTVPNHSTWWIMTAGRVPPDPARLLSSQRMHNLVQNLANSGNYDLILYDTPPALGLADASLIAENLDGLILLVSLNYVNRDLPREALHGLLKTRVPLLGLVTNVVKERSHSHASSPYSSRYGNFSYNYADPYYSRNGDYYQATIHSYYGQDNDSTSLPPNSWSKGKAKRKRLRFFDSLYTPLIKRLKDLANWLDGQ